MSGHVTRAVRVATSIGPAWQAQCTCGWMGRKYWTGGARRTALSERWSHEIDVEDATRASVQAGESPGHE